MRDRLRSCSEYLLTGAVLSILFLGMVSTPHPADHLQEKPMTGIRYASYAGSAPAMGISASVIAGPHRRAGMMTAEWSVCWSGPDGAEKKCFDLTITWRAKMRGQE